MTWTSWCLLADCRAWYSNSFDCDGPACYELAIAGPRGGDLKTVYVGHTGNEKQRMTSYGRDGSHLAQIIASHLTDGWYLHYRSWACPNKRKAEAMERSLLRQFDYPWNGLREGK